VLQRPTLLLRLGRLPLVCSRFLLDRSCLFLSLACFFLLVLL
jgi:hypothetical protein